jgi:hypothetical protein
VQEETDFGGGGAVVDGGFVVGGFGSLLPDGSQVSAVLGGWVGVEDVLWPTANGRLVGYDCVCHLAQ